MCILYFFILFLIGLFSKTHYFNNKMIGGAKIRRNEGQPCDTKYPCHSCLKCFRGVCIVPKCFEFNP